MTPTTLSPSTPPAPLPAAAAGLSPLDIRHQEFPGRLGGYDRAHVRAFLGQVADALEALLHERQGLHERVGALEADLEERRAAEDEIRRAVVAAERMGHDLRENAARECEALLDSARARTAELEAAHRVREAELEAAFRTRAAELERGHHALTLERDRAHAERTVYLERAHAERHADLTGRLAAARSEYLQFVAQYRALVASFADLSARHLPLLEDAALPAGAPLESPVPAPLPAPPSEHGSAERGPAEETRVQGQQFL